MDHIRALWSHWGEDDGGGGLLLGESVVRKPVGEGELRWRRHCGSETHICDDDCPPESVDIILKFDLFKYVRRESSSYCIRVLFIV